MAPFPASGSWYFGVAIQSNGQIITAGQGPNEAAMVNRFNADGSLDTSYGTAGSASTPLGVADQYNAVAVQPSDGEVIAVGYMSDAWPNKEVPRQSIHDRRGSRPDAF